MKFNDNIESLKNQAEPTFGTFGWAIWKVAQGHKASRQGWNGKGMSIELQVPDEHSKMGLPYLFMNTVTGERVPWLASQTDMLATDWACG